MCHLDHPSQVYHLHRLFLKVNNSQLKEKQRLVNALVQFNWIICWFVTIEIRTNNKVWRYTAAIYVLRSYGAVYKRTIAYVPNRCLFLKMNLIDFKSFSAISVRKRMVRLFNFEPPTCKTSRLFKIQSEQIVPAISYMMASFFSPFFPSSVYSFFDTESN